MDEISKLNTNEVLLSSGIFITKSSSSNIKENNILFISDHLSFLSLTFLLRPSLRFLTTDFSDSIHSLDRNLHYSACQLYAHRRNSFCQYTTEIPLSSMVFHFFLVLPTREFDNPWKIVQLFHSTIQNHDSSRLCLVLHWLDCSIQKCQFRTGLCGCKVSLCLISEQNLLLCISIEWSWRSTWKSGGCVCCHSPLSFHCLDLISSQFTKWYWTKFFFFWLSTLTGYFVLIF